MFSEFVFAICILPLLANEVNKSFYNTEKFNIDLQNGNLTEDNEKIRERIKHPPLNENFLSEGLYNNYIENVSGAVSSENIIYDTDYIGIENTENIETVKVLYNTDSDPPDKILLPNELKSEKLTFVDIIQHFMVKNLQSPAVNQDRNGDHNNKEEEMPHSGSGISHSLAQNSSSELNLTSANGTNSSHTKKATCLERDIPNDIGNVEILNATALLKLMQSNANITSRSMPAECYLIYFFSPYCPFSTQGSAYVNALARALPHIPVYGLNSVEYHSLNARYSIMGTPSLVLFHNGHTVGRYNASEYSTYYLESFIRHFTNQEINSINVTSQDFKASLPSTTVKSSNLALYIAWAFLLICAGYIFLNSEFYAKLTETVLNNWREAEAQHEHDE